MPAIYKNFTLDKCSESEKLYGKSFVDCAREISTLDTFKKAELAAEVQEKLSTLYENANTYDNKDYAMEDRVNASEYMNIMSRIKRWELILYWLFEIDILMQETPLDQIIKDAEHKLEEVNYNPHAVRVRIKPVVDMETGITRRQKVEVNIKDEYESLLAERDARGYHTDEIIAQAKLLAQKYIHE